MKMLRYQLVFLALIISTFSLQSCAQKLEEEHLLLKKTEFKQRLSEEKTPQLVDVRTKEEYDQGSIEGAINYDYLDGTFEKNLEKLDKTRPVFVYCAVGGRSGKAAKLLKQKGFTAVIDLKGGYNAWSKSP